MNNSIGCATAVILLAVVLGGSGESLGQGTDAALAAAQTNGEDASTELTASEVQAALDALEADASIDEAVKRPLRNRYEQALEALASAAEFATTAQEYRDSIETGPQQAADLRAQLQAIESRSDAPSQISGTTEELQNELESTRVSLQLMRQQLTELTEQLSRMEGRPVEIPKRMADVQSQLSEIRERLASPEFAETDGGISITAERLLLRANEMKLAKELEMLEQEQLSQSARKEMLEAQQTLLTRQIADAEQRLARLNEAVSTGLSNLAVKIRRAADAVPPELLRQNDEARRVAAEVIASADELEAVIDDAEQIEEVQEDLRRGREELTADFASVREQLELGGSGSAIAQLLFDLDRQCLRTQAELRDNDLPELEQPRIAALRVREKLRDHEEIEGQLGSGLPEQLRRIVAVRREALEELERQYSSLTRALAMAERARQEYLDQTEAVRGFVAEKLFGFGLKSCPPFGADTLGELPDSLAWLFQPAHWQQVGVALGGVFRQRPLLTLAMLLLAGGLWLVRPRLIRSLEETGRRIKHVSKDKYRTTVEAFLWTLLLALPIPILFGCMSWALGEAPSPSDWFSGFRSGLQRASGIVLIASIVMALLRRGGLGDLHFGWRAEILAQLRTAIFRIAVVYVPALVLTISCTYGDAAAHLQSLGRVSLMLGHLWMAYQMYRLFFSRQGLLSHSLDRENLGILLRWRRLWLTLLFAMPLTLVALMALGYVITSLIFSLGLLVTLAIIAGGFFLYGFALRWFVMKQRKRALEEAIERRRARQEEDEQESPTEVVDLEPEDASDFDLDQVAGQTRELLQAIFSLLVLVGVIGFWARAFPIIDLAGSVTIPFLGGLTLLRVIVATVIAVVTFVVVKNLPGLLESVLLRSKDTVPGTRLAIYTLCQYGATALGAWLFLNALHVDWAQFGWAVAALSVGIGFGLQEVVANFVCGLILLFERPIRVGDIVTVESTTGTVSKIHLRATTITNWDRQEFVVPNKTLITNTLLNWTLSAPLNRVVIPVGVAYGSDTERAREVLLAVADDHPNVLENPKPMATFEQFADSSLNIVLRVYLPDLDSRLSTISELHTEINRRFAEEGIEIAFPQLDLHMRNGWERFGGKVESETATT